MSTSHAMSDGRVTAVSRPYKEGHTHQPGERPGPKATRDETNATSIDKKYYSMRLYMNEMYQ